MGRRIVIGYEATESGRDALHLGRLLAEVLAAAPVVATVTPRAVVAPAPDFAAVADVLGGFDFETRAIGSRTPVGGLRKLAADVEAPLIVLGSSDRGSAGKALLGGTGESLTHGAECAIAVAPRGYAARDARRLLAIGAAFDGTGESWSALITAIMLVERTRGTLTVLTADDYPPFEAGAAWSALAVGELAGIEQERKRRMLEVALGAAPSGLSAEGRLLSGDAGEALTAAGEDLDLIVAGSRGHGLLRRTLLGSTTRTLLHGAPCPVLILPRELRADPLRLDRSGREVIGPIAPQPH